MASIVHKRQHDLDWIKVIVTLVVFLYHSSMFFNPFPWHVKNNELDYGTILAFSLFAGSWMMPIFFAISGVSVFNALKKRRSSNFVRERLTRLGVPLLLGAFILAPPQVFIERITHGQFSGSLFSFLPHYFEGLYLEIGGAGNFAFFGLHLWYLLVLIVFSFLTLPLFKRLSNAKRFKVMHMLVLPFLLFAVGLIQTVNLGGWDLVFYFLIFVFGYYYFTSESFMPLVKKTIAIHFTIAIVSTVIFIAWFMNGMPKPGTPGDITFYFIHTLNSWSWMLVIFYLADKYLSFSNRFLKYANEAAMPFYIIHQPVIVFVGFMIRDLEWSIPFKLLFLVTVSFTIILASYHYLVRNFNGLRFMFGTKAKTIRKAEVDASVIMK